MPPLSPKRRWTDRLLILGPCLLIGIVGLIVAALFIKPAPPQKIVFAAGPKGGAYEKFAQAYAEYFKEAGIDVEIRNTAGSVENIRLLADGSSGVAAALVQGGVAHAVQDEHKERLQAVLAVFYEPLWLFSRRDLSAQRLTDLAGHRISIGPAESGTAALASSVIRDTFGSGDSTVHVVPELSDLPTLEAIQAIQDGRIHAFFTVLAPTAPYLPDILSNPVLNVTLVDRIAALDHRSDSLVEVVLPRGAVIPWRDLPDRDLPMIAATASIVVHEDTHPAVVQLLVNAAVETHRGGGLLHEPGTFPNTAMVDLPLHADVRHHLEKGPSWLQRTFPFWLASLIDRTVILAVPLAALLLPLFRAAPPTYRWRIRSRIYRWYAQLREIDERLRHEAPRETIEADARRLTQLEAELLDVHVPLSYMEEFYHLRLHVDYVNRRLQRHLERTPV